MKKYIKIILGLTIYIATIYSATAFYYLSFNPLYWEEGARYLFSFFGMIIPLIIACYLLIMNEIIK